MSHYPRRAGHHLGAVLNLGKTNPNDPNEKFSMSVLACNLSQEVNGVSWLHGEVSKEILGNMWPGYFKNELHIGYVTNGRAFPDLDATSLRRLYARYFADGFEGHAYDIPAWAESPQHPRRGTVGRAHAPQEQAPPSTSASVTATPARCGSTRRARCCRSSRASSPTC